MTKTKHKYVCVDCGSEGLLWDAYAVWDVDKQDFVLHSTLDEAQYCGCCDTYDPATECVEVTGADRD